MMGLIGIGSGGSAGAGAASSTSFDPTGTGLASTNVQDALEEVAAASAGDVTSYNAQALNSGNITLAPAAGKRIHGEEITVGGSARTSNIVLSTTNRVAGDRIACGVNLPATASIVLSFRDATVGGTELAQVTTTAAARRLKIEFILVGSAWVLDTSKLPA